jgi:HK97 family phage portal protein
LGTRPSESDLPGQIEWAVDRRLGLADYLGIPAVARGRGLLISLIAQMEPVAWANGYPLTDQPRVLLRPAPGVTRHDYLTELGASLIDHGDAYLWQPRSGRNASGYPDVSIVLPADEVHVSWSDDSRLFRRYRWRDRELAAGGSSPELVHVSINRASGELTGHSPLDAIAASLDRIIAAELFAEDWFETGAVPSATLKYEGTLSDAEADAAQARWVSKRREHLPAILSRGWDLKESGSDPEKSQLLDTRRWGVLEVARGLGIVPAELLLAEVGGSSLTYQNSALMLDNLVRVTVQPTYLAPIEEALSDLLPGTQAARFDPAELFRLQTAERFGAYAVGLGAGFLQLEQIDRWEGWRRDVPPPIPPSLAPTPRPVETPALPEPELGMMPAPVGVLP